jgi:hypothetical protein
MLRQPSPAIGRLAEQQVRFLTGDPADSDRTVGAGGSNEGTTRIECDGGHVGSVRREGLRRPVFEAKAEH